MAEILIFGKNNTFPVGAMSERHELCVTTRMAEAKKRLVSEEFALIIIDLEDREKSGMDLARFVRQIPRQCMTPILFFSRDRRMEKKAFHEIHCYDYFLKPIDMEDIIQILYLCMRRITIRKKNNTIVFSVGSDRYPVLREDILYLENVPRNVIVHTLSMDLTVPYLKLADFVGQYGAGFVQIHRSIVVNLNKIRCVDYSKALIELRETGEQLSIGRTYLPVIRKLFDENRNSIYNTNVKMK